MRALSMVAMVGALVAVTRTISADDVQKRIEDLCWGDRDHASHGDPFQEVKEMGEKGRKALLRMAESRKSNDVCALDFLGNLAEPRALPIARRILADKHTDRWARGEALDIVGALRDRQSLPHVFEAYESRDSGLVSHAISALGQIRDERGLALLRQALTDPKRLDKQTDLIRAVGREGHEAAIEPLLAALEQMGKRDRYIAEVSRSLARIGTTRSRALAVALVAEVRDPSGRLKVAEGAREGIRWILRDQRNKTAHPDEATEIDAQIEVLRLLAEEARQNLRCGIPKPSVAP